MPGWAMVIARPMEQTELVRELWGAQLARIAR